METPSREDRINLWKHMTAASSFREALLIVNELVRTSPPLDSPTRNAMTVAIVVLYARPFKQTPPLKLEPKFIPSEHQPTHDYLIELRDKVIAHRDKAKPGANWEDINQVRVVVKNGVRKITSRSPHVLNEKAPDLANLLTVLVSIMEDRINAFVASYLNNLSSEDASYVLNLEENPQLWLKPS